MEKIIYTITVLFMFTFPGHAQQAGECSQKHVKFRRGFENVKDNNEAFYDYSLMADFWAYDRYVAKELFFEKMDGTIVFDNVVVEQFSKGKIVKSKKYKLKKYDKMKNYYKLSGLNLDKFVDMKALESGKLIFSIQSNDIVQCQFSMEVLSSPPSY